MAIRPQHRQRGLAPRRLPLSGARHPQVPPGRRPGASRPGAIRTYSPMSTPTTWPPSGSASPHQASDAARGWPTWSATPTSGGRRHPPSPSCWRRVGPTSPRTPGAATAPPAGTAPTSASWPTTATPGAVSSPDRLR